LSDSDALTPSQPYNRSGGRHKVSKQFFGLTLEEVEDIIKSNISITDQQLYDGVYAVAVDIEVALMNKNSASQEQETGVHTMNAIELYCCGCEREVKVRLTDGAEIYPHREDLQNLPFWTCDTCKNYVGCHHKTDQPTKPLGVIPTPQIRAKRSQIHALIDPLWRDGNMRRQSVYKMMALQLGVEEFHTAEIKSIEEADRALVVARSII
jgi:hypothetical protein